MGLGFWFLGFTILSFRVKGIGFSVLGFRFLVSGFRV